MKTIIILFTAFLLPAVLFSQPKRITLRHLGTSNYYTTVDSAYYFAQNGDTMIFPGGDFVLPTTANGWEIDKSLHLMGAGWRSDSSGTTGATRLVGLVTLKDNADNGSIEGVYITKNLYFAQPVTGFLVNRCLITQKIVIQSSLAENNIFRESYIVADAYPWDCFSAGNAQNNKFYNCAMQGSLSNLKAGNEFQNCVLRVHDIPNSEFTSFTNCIFTFSQSGGYASNYLTFTNCLFSNGTAGFGSLSIVSGCLTSINPETIFENAPYNNVSIQANNYHLKPNNPGGPGVPAFTNPAIGAGINGVDCGIFDGIFPLKENAHPSHPRIKFLRVAPATDANGNLNIQVKVEAENN